MRTKNKKHWVFLLVVFSLLSACSPATQPEVSASYSLPQVWFDAPLPGTAYPLGEIQVVAHAADKAGITEVELSLESGLKIGSQPGNLSDTISTASFLWHPPDPGIYILQVRALNTNGDWSPYTYTDVVVVGDDEIALNPEDNTGASNEEQTPIPTTAAPVVTDTPEACTDRAAFVSETVIDGMVFKPGESFTKTWTLRNAGTCTWTRRYALSFYDGYQMAGTSHAPISKQVLPGETITLSVNLTAPSQLGTYRGRWMIMNDQGVLFGLGEQGNVAFWVEIVVAREDTRAPSVDVSYAPNGRGEPRSSQVIVFTASAADDVKVTKIEIYFSLLNTRGNLIGTCNNMKTCEIQGGPYSAGNYQLQAVAYDAAGNAGNSEILGVLIYE